MQISENPANIDLKVGGHYTVRLQGLGTSGYTWSAVVTGEAQTVSLVKSTAMPASSTLGDMPKANTNADELFTIQAQAAGSATVQFMQRRSWEHDTPPVKQVTVEVHVQPSPTNS